MKELKIIVVVLFLALPIWAIYRYVDEMTPTWQVEAAQQAAIDLQTAKQNARIDTEAHAQRTQDWTEAQQAFLWVIVAGAAGVLAIGIWAHYDKRRESWARAVDGTFALQRNGIYLLDPNKSAFGVFGVDPKTGNLISDANLIGPDRQLAYAMDVQRTRTAAAVTGGDGFRYAATGKFLAGAYDPVRRDAPLLEVDDDEDQEMPSTWQPLTLVDAFNQSTPDRWLLGQNATGPCEFSIQTTHHIGILGAQGTGKTAGTATLMMLYALKNLAHVICLDGKGGVDWMRYKSHIEVYLTDDTMIGDQVNAIHHIYQTRLKELGRAGASDIYELDYQMKPIMVIMEEFGSTMDTLKAENSKAHAATELQIKEIFRKGRSTGIHLVLIDQLMKGWPGVMKANAKGIIAYKIGGQQGNAFNAYELHKLADRGQFWHNGDVYEAWDTKPNAKAMLQNLQPSKIKLLTDVQSSVVGKELGTGSEMGGEGKGVLDPSPARTGSTSSTREPDRVLPSSTSSLPVLTGRALSSADKEIVLRTYARTHNKSATCKELWGRKNGETWQWLQEVLQGETLQ